MSWTNIREPAEHTCPWLNSIPNCAPSIAISISQSSKNILADFPPSSNVAGIINEHAAEYTSCPTAVEPVNASFLNPWCFNM